MRDFKRDIALLRRTQLISQATATKYAPTASSSHSVPDSNSSAPLVLPAMQSTVARLLDFGINESSAEQVDSFIQHASVRLKDYCVSDFTRRRQVLQTVFQEPKALERVINMYRTLYLQTTQGWVSHILSKYVPRLVAARSAYQRGRSCTPPHLKRPFNQSAIPVLELFFDANAFPSRLDKLELASKCDMDYRQIHVWFQNRRSRFRKEGKVLNQPPTRNGLQELENHVANALLSHHVGEEEADGGTTDCDDDTRNVDDYSAILYPHSKAPVHAYPYPYPPSCPYDAFPPTPEGRALKTPWRRSPCSTYPSPIHIDFDEFVAEFAKLTLDCPTERQHHARAHRLPQGTSRPDLSFVTPCCRAPHPALILKPERQSRRSCPLTAAPCRSLTFPSTTQRGFPLKRPQTPCVPQFIGSSVTAVSLPNGGKGSTPPSSAKRSLPRRVPKHSPIPHATNSSLVSPTRRLLSSRSSSTSSLSSISSQSTSDVESSLRTPPSVSICLPDASIQCFVEDGHGPEIKELLLPTEDIPLYPGLVNSLVNPMTGLNGVHGFTPMVTSMCYTPLLTVM